jgi:CBS domain-containing protein
MATVADIMDSDPITVVPDDSVETVIRVLQEHELTGVPVVNGSDRCVGIVTEADLILTEDGTDLHLPHHIDIMGGVIFIESLKHFGERVQKAFASDVQHMMTPDPVTIEPSATVHEAARLISRSKHNRLPVVEHGRLVGVVTRVDVLDALAHEE